MKNQLLLLLFSIFGLVLSAQQINSSVEGMVNGAQNAVTLDLPTADKKLVEKEWRAFMKPYGTLKKVRRGKEFFQEGARISAISSDAMTVYSRVDDMGSGARVNLWMDLGGGEYIGASEHPDMYDGAEELLKDFEFSVRKSVATLDIEILEDQLKTQEKNLKKLERDNAKLHEAIEKAKATIAQAEEDIITNDAEQVETKVQIEQQIERVTEAKEKHRTMKRDDNE